MKAIAAALLLGVLRSGCAEFGCDCAIEEETHDPTYEARCVAPGPPTAAVADGGLPLGG